MDRIRAFECELSYYAYTTNAILPSVGENTNFHNSRKRSRSLCRGIAAIRVVLFRLHRTVSGELSIVCQRLLGPIYVM